METTKNIINSFPKIFSRQQKKNFLLLFFLSMVVMIFETISIASIYPILNLVFEGSDSFKEYNFINLDAYSEEKILLLLCISFILIFFIKAVTLTFFSFKKNQFVHDIRTIQTNNLFKSYLYEDYFFHINNNSAKLIRNLNDAGLLSVFARSLVDFFSEVVMFTGIFILLLFLNAKVTVNLTLFFSFFGLMFLKFFQSKASIWGDESQKYRGLKLKNLKESFGAIRDIKILGKENFFFETFSKNNKFENLFTKKNSFIVSLPKIWFEWLVIIVMLALIIYLTSGAEDNKSIIPFLGVYGLAAYRLVPSITKISNYLQDMKFCYPAVKPYINNDYRIKYNSNKLISGNPIEKIDFKSKIVLRNVNFSFPNSSEAILDNLNVEIKKNKTIGIYGSSGAGKTTFINIIMGLLRTNSGDILVDEKNIYEDLNKWQKIISYIPQNVFIIDDMILNNVALGEPKDNIDITKLENSLKVARIYDFVKSLPKSIYTICGESGDKLSGGQKQRLGIARALYRDSEILIFDEFTNFLDKQNEEKILNDVKKMQGKTKILISHDPNVLKHCDEIYELSEKKLKQISSQSIQNFKKS